MWYLYILALLCGFITFFIVISLIDIFGDNKTYRIKYNNRHKMFIVQQCIGLYYFTFTNTAALNNLSGLSLFERNLNTQCFHTVEEAEKYINLRVEALRNIKELKRNLKEQKSKNKSFVFKKININI